MHVQDRDAHGAAERPPVNVATPLQRFVGAVAGRLRPKPDLSLINEKFTDSFERELLLRKRW